MESERHIARVEASGCSLHEHRCRVCVSSLRPLRAKVRALTDSRRGSRGVRAGAPLGVVGVVPDGTMCDSRTDTGRRAQYTNPSRRPIEPADPVMFGGEALSLSASDLT